MEKPAPVCRDLVLTNLVKPLKKLHPVVFLALAAVVGIVFRLGGA